MEDLPSPSKRWLTIQYQILHNPTDGGSAALGKSSSKKTALVVLKYEGSPECVHVPVPWRRFVKENVDASTYVYTNQSDDKETVHLGLTDALFAPYNKAPDFFDKMMLIDPDGVTNNCGYISMLLYLMFLTMENKNEPEELKIKFLKDMKSKHSGTLLPKMRELMKDWIVEETNDAEQNVLVQHEELFATFQRHTPSTEDAWRRTLEWVVNVISKDDIKYEMLESYEKGPMDVKNWGVFAKRTRSRIILVTLT